MNNLTFSVLTGGYMSINDSEECDRLVVKVVGVGGVGVLALESMIKAKIRGVDFIAVDTEAQALETSSAPIKIRLGVNTTKDGGSGSRPESDRADAEESRQEIGEALKGADVVIIVARMGGCTGTGAVQVIADAAKVSGALMTVGIVTLPFNHEGKIRMETAEEGVRALGKRVDSLIVIPNEGMAAVGSTEQNLLEVLTGDAILTEAVRGITDLLRPRFPAIDPGDIIRVLPSEYPITFGIGEASGHDRALKAAQKAMHPLSRGGVDIAQASDVLVNIAGSSDMTMADYNEVNKFICSKISDDTQIKICFTVDDRLEDKIKVTVYLSKSEPTATIRTENTNYDVPSYLL
ncbi:Tubulin/FtsZ, GTPase [Pelobacter propionicus DSM 2379]|uniref:Cell division protein FtsZ n=2 Tax=Pelobacter propionicus TaxID=29543 RepID=A1AQ68_PELPD|nr:Tubulin/FtsZ, GTPase [Pelobacter propionicus DSM 2379]